MPQGRAALVGRSSAERPPRSGPSKEAALCGDLEAASPAPRRFQHKEKCRVTLQPTLDFLRGGSEGRSERKRWLEGSRRGEKSCASSISYPSFSGNAQCVENDFGDSG